MEYSIIIPVFNEQDSILTLFEELGRATGSFKGDYEILFINDGSTDNTLSILESLATSSRFVRIMNFTKNMGQGKAIEEGFRNTKGEIIITIDGDLQNDPQDIPLLIAKLDEGYDLVCGWRFSRKDGFIKKLKSCAGNHLQKKITGLNLHDISCTLRAYRRKIITGVSFNDKHDFTLLPYIISKKHNIKIAEVKVNHRQRLFNKSKYGLIESAYGAVWSYLKLIRR